MMSSNEQKGDAHFIHTNVCEERVHPSRTIELQLRRSASPVNMWVKRMNWETFCAITSPTYPDLVQEFYSKMYVVEGEDDVVYTDVRNKLIKVDVEMLQEILSVPNDGTELRKVDDERKVKGFDSEKYLNPDVQVKELYADCTHQNARMAHYLLINYVMPKTECVNLVSAKERCVIWHMLEKKRLNLPVLLISQMKETDGTLPYGSLITKILQREGVFIPEGEFKKQGIPITLDTLQKLPHSQKATEKHKRKVVELEVDFDPVKQAIEVIKRRLNVGSKSGIAIPEAPKAPNPTEVNEQVTNAFRTTSSSICVPTLPVGAEIVFDPVNDAKQAIKRRLNVGSSSTLPCDAKKFDFIQMPMFADTLKAFRSTDPTDDQMLCPLQTPLDSTKTADKMDANQVLGQQPEVYNALTKEEMRILVQDKARDLMTTTQTIQYPSMVGAMEATQALAEQNLMFKELSYIKAQLLQLSVFVQQHNLSQYTQELASLQRSAHEQLYKLQQISQGAPTLPAIAVAATDKVKPILDELHRDVEDIKSQQNINQGFYSDCGTNLADLIAVVSDIRRDQEKTNSAVTNIENTLVSYGRQLQDVIIGAETADRRNFENQRREWEAGIFQMIEKILSAVTGIEDYELSFGSQMQDLVRLVDQIEKSIASTGTRQLQCQDFQRNTLHIQSTAVSGALMWQNKIIMILVDALLKVAPMTDEGMRDLTVLMDKFSSTLSFVQRFEAPAEQLPTIKRQMVEFLQPETLEVDIVGMRERKDRVARNKQAAAEFERKKKAKQAES